MTEPTVVAHDLADALTAKERWRQQEKAYNNRIQELQDELDTVLRLSGQPKVSIPGYTFAIATNGGISIQRQ